MTLKRAKDKLTLLTNWSSWKMDMK